MVIINYSTILHPVTTAAEQWNGTAKNADNKKQRRKTDSHESGIFSSYLQLTTNIPSETKTVYNS